MIAREVVAILASTLRKLCCKSLGQRVGMEKTPGLVIVRQQLKKPAE